MGFSIKSISNPIRQVFSQTIGGRAAPLLGVLNPFTSSGEGRKASGQTLGDPLNPLEDGKDGVPAVPSLGDVPTDIDQGAVDAARRDEAERIHKRRGRASTISKKAPGLLSAQTTGLLNGQ
jgi:hypothetical protein